MTKEYSRPLSIAIDGPVSAGKSTLSDALARKLGILHLDTGAMYRAMGLYALENGIDPKDETALEDVIKNNAAVVSVEYADNMQKTLLNGQDITHRLREETVGAAASAVSRYPAVRRYLVGIQQRLSREQSLLIDGRDIGTVVLPDASIKIFLTATPEARALRRYTQIIADGEKVNYPKVLEDLIKRDAQDTGREHDPLRPAEDAVVLDTSALSFEETLAKLLALVEAKRDRQA
ncbi:MAG: (d)CMP kinase [Eubacteriales bacterium]|nr:(d)CMP kinase [Eubacteriales bacterium]